MAISYSEENTAKIMRDAWSMTFEETINQCSSWQEAYQTYTEECSKHLSQWYEVVKDVTEKTGLKFDTLKEKMSNITTIIFNEVSHFFGTSFLLGLNFGLRYLLFFRF